MHIVTFSSRAPVNIVLVGLGGTGSLLLTHLLRIDQGIRALGGAGLHVRAFDPDRVSQTNLTRQNFAPGDVGRNKAVVLVERCNLYAGLSWEAQPRRLEKGDLNTPVHLLITCVDSGQSRREIGALLRQGNPHYWVDCGNDARSGQVIVGQPGKRGGLPDILSADPSGMQGEDDDSPSCSAVEALTRQHPFINPEIALRAGQMIGEMLYHGVLSAPAVYVNMQGNMRAIAQELPRGKAKVKDALLPFPQPTKPARRQRRVQA